MVRDLSGRQRGVARESASERAAGCPISGSITLGVPYAIGFSVGSSTGFPNRTGWLAVPVLGPWATLLARRSCAERSDTSARCHGDDSLTRVLLILDGLVQTSGGTLLAVALFAPKSVWVRDQPSYYLVPGPVGSGYGLDAIGRF